MLTSFLNQGGPSNCSHPADASSHWQENVPSKVSRTDWQP